MKTVTKMRIVAVVVCVCIYVLYITISVMAGWKHGGGILVIAVLFGIMRAIWKSASQMGENIDNMPHQVNTQRCNNAQESITESSQLPEELMTDNVKIENHLPKESDPDPFLIPIDGNTQNKQLELNNILNGLFVVWIIYSFIASLIQFIINLDGDYLISTLDFAFNIIGIIGIIGMILKKRWGIFIVAIFFLLQFIVCTYVAMSDPSYSTETIKVVVKVVIFIALLFIRKDGYSAWETIWNNGYLLSKQEYTQQKEQILDNVELVASETKVAKIEEIKSFYSSPTQENIELEHAGIIQGNNHRIKNDVQTHWQKYKLYYIIAIAICMITSSVIIVSIQIKQKKQYVLELQQKLQIEELVEKAVDAYKLSFYDLALNYLEEALSFDSNNLVIHYYAGRVNYKKKNYSKAKEHFEIVYNCNTTKKDFSLGEDTISFNKLLNNYCRTLRELSYLDNDKLMLISQEYISLYPNESNAYRSIILAYHKIGNNTKAKEWAQKMIDKFPQDDDSYFCLAYILTEMEKEKEAIVYYKKCIELNPIASNAYNNMGYCYSKIGNFSKAYECWRKAVQIDSNETAINNLKEYGQKY